MSRARLAARARGLGRFARAVLARFAADRGPSLAASLTYTTLLALVPLLAIGLALMTALPIFETFARTAERFVEEQLLPPRLGEAVLTHLREFSAGAARLTLIGLAALALSGFFMMQTIETAFNGIWRVRRRRPFALRALIYWGVVTLGPVLVGASLTMTSYLVSASMGLVTRVPGGQASLLFVAQLALMSIAFTLLYFVVPNRAVLFRHALLGGTTAALLFEMTNRGFGLYVAHVSTYTLVYGAFAAVPLFLVWIYLLWVVTLAGAVLTAMLPDYAHTAAYSASPPPPALADVLEVLRVLVHAQRGAQTPTSLRVAARARLPLDRCEATLDALADHGWVARAGAGGWLLACDPDVVTAAEVYDGFDQSAAARPGPSGAVAALLAGSLAGVRKALDVPLTRLAEPATRTDAASRTEKGRARR